MDDLYLASLAANKGFGFFPIGASGMWHGGIHLQAPDEATPVVAVADGVLVAYRLTGKWKRDKVGDQEIAYSNNFALLRHEHAWAGGAKTVWFSLYMHLKPLEEYTAEQKQRGPPLFVQKTYSVKRLPSHGKGIPIFDPETVPGASVLVVVPERARLRLGPAITQASSRWKGYRWAEWDEFEGYAKVPPRSVQVAARRGTDEECVVVKGTTPVVAGRALTDGPTQRSTVVGLLPAGAVLDIEPLRADAPDPKEGSFLRLPEKRFIEFSKKWLEVGNRITARYDGVVVEKVTVRQGEVLGYPGAYGSAERLLHYEVFSSESAAESKADETGPNWSGWNIVRDPSGFENDHACDRAKFLGLIDGVGPDGIKDGKLSAKEIVAAAGSPAIKSSLERMAVLHGTEWSRVVTNSWWERLREKLHDGYRAFVSHVESVQWWHQLPPDAGLPEPVKVLHFHPVGFAATANTWLKQFTLEDKDRIFKVVKEAESGIQGNPYSAINDDREFSGKLPTSYSHLVHVGLSWGIIQFTQDGGALGFVLKRMRQSAPELFERTFGQNWAELLALTEPSGVYVDSAYAPYAHSGLSRWVKDGRPSTGEYRGSRVRPIPFAPGGPPEDLWKGSWKAAFKAAGEHEEFKQAQRAIAYRDYFDPALRLCQKWRIRTDRGIAIALDRTIQQGTGGAPAIFKKASLACGGGEFGFAPADERTFLNHIADAFNCDPVQKADVAQRVKRLLNSPVLKQECYDPDSYPAAVGQV